MPSIFHQRRSELPPEYVAFIESRGGYKGFLIGEDADYVVLWDWPEIQQAYQEAQMKEFMSERWFVFGSNGGGEMLCFDLSSGTSQVYWITWISMSDDDDALLRFNSFTEIADAVPPV